MLKFTYHIRLLKKCDLRYFDCGMVEFWRAGLGILETADVLRFSRVSVYTE